MILNCFLFDPIVLIQSVLDLFVQYTLIKEVWLMKISGGVSKKTNNNNLVDLWKQTNNLINEVS